MDWVLNVGASLLDAHGFTLLLQTPDRTAVDAKIAGLIDKAKAAVQQQMAALPEVKRLARLRAEQSAMQREADRLKSELAARQAERGNMVSAVQPGLAKTLAMHDRRTAELQAELAATDPATLAGEIGDAEAVLRDQHAAICSAVSRAMRDELAGTRQAALEKLVASMEPHLSAIAPLSGAVISLTTKGVPITFAECVKG